jgi:hypothetical protein
MPTSSNPTRTSHPNLIVEDYDASLAHFAELFGSLFLMDLRKPEWNACLIDIGGVIFELFAPVAFLLNSRHGPHFLGMEYEAKMADVRPALAAHNVRIFRELTVAVHTNPLDSLGMDLEFYEGSFYTNEPPVLPKKMVGIEYWRDEHPLGLAGLKAYTVVVSDIEQAKGFVQSLLSGEVVYDEARPAIGARAIGLQVADAVLELLTPTGPGEIKRCLETLGEGMRSVVFRASSLDKARRYFEERKVPLVPAADPRGFAVAPEANRGVIFEFAE